MGCIEVVSRGEMEKKSRDALPISLNLRREYDGGKISKRCRNEMKLEPCLSFKNGSTVSAAFLIGSHHPKRSHPVELDCTSALLSVNRVEPQSFAEPDYDPNTSGTSALALVFLTSNI